jgi:hypothetical protein
MDTACTARCNPAAELRAGQPQFLAQSPEQWCIGFSGKRNILAIDLRSYDHFCLFLVDYSVLKEGPIILGFKTLRFK